MIEPAPRHRGRWRDRIVPAALLALAWTLLWGRFTWTHLIGGLLVAVVVLVFFPLPRITFTGRVRPVWTLWFLLRFLGDVVVASVQVAWLAFSFGRVPHSAVIAVRLRAPSDLHLTLIAETVSLIPGSLIVEAEPATGTLYIHVLGVSGTGDVERFRRNVLALEARLVRAIGSDRDIQRTRLPVTDQKGHPT